MNETWIYCVLALATPATAMANVITPEEVIERLVEHNPTLQAAVADLEQARLTVLGESHRYRPTLSVSAGLSTNDTPSLSAAGVQIGSLSSLSLSTELAQRFSFGTELSLSVEISRFEQEYAAPNLAGSVPLGPGYGLETKLSLLQPLLRDFGTDVGESQLRIARANLSGAQQARLQTASELLLETLEAYWDLWLAQESLRIRQQASDVAKTQLDEAALRAEKGDLAPLDVLPLQTELASARESLATAKESVGVAWLELARLIGAPIHGTEIQTASPPSSPSVVVSVDRAIALAVESSYQLRSLEAAVTTARVDLAVAEDQAAPRLDAQAWVSLQGLGDDSAQDAFRQIEQLDAVSAFVGLSGEINLDRTREKSAAARARLAVVSAEKQLQAAEDQVRALAAQTVARIDSGRERMKLTVETASVAARALEGQEVRFEKGDGTALDLVVAQQQLREAKLRSAQAKVSLINADLELKHTTARLLDTLEVSFED